MDTTEPTPRTGKQRTISRRSLLKGTAVSMPMVLTLQSGAALARSSNLISASPSSYTDAEGRTLCLDTDSVYPAASSGDVYDVGDPPYLRVSAINDRDHRLDANSGSSAVSEAAMCQNGGAYYYKDAGWQEVRVPQGILVSATALTSFASGIVLTDL